MKKLVFPVKIIFLDIDGVINIPPYLKFNDICMSNLEEVIQKTGAKIVISSSWRDHDHLRMETNFKKHGFTDFLWDQVIDITCRGYQYVIKGSKLPIVRGNEIKQWVDTRLKYPWHSDKSLDKEYQILNADGSFKFMRCNELHKDYSYVILDDDSDMLYEQKDNFILTDGSVGLSNKNTKRTIEILNKL